MQFCCLVTLRGSLYVCMHEHLTGVSQVHKYRIPYRSSPDSTSSRGLEIRYVSTDLMYYLTRHCTPWSSAAFFMVFHAVCCSSTSFTLKSTSAVLLVFLIFTCSSAFACNARKQVLGYPLGTCTEFSSF